jgi:hypothetical protein
MGTGILATLNRNGSITPFVTSVDRLKKRLGRWNRLQAASPSRACAQASGGAAGRTRLRSHLL